MSRNPARVLAEKRKADVIDALSDTEIAEAQFGVPAGPQYSSPYRMDGPFSPAMYAAMMRGDKVTKDTTFIPYGDYMKGVRAPRKPSFDKSAPMKRTYQKKVYQIPSLSVKDYGQARLKRGSKFTRKNYGATFGTATKLQKSNRTKYGYTGRGLYGAKFISRIGRALTSPSFIKGVKRGVGYGADALTALAYIDPELIPVAAGAQGVSAYMGRGSYTSMSHGVNDLISGGMSSVPRMMSVPDETGSLIVSHTERVSDIIAPGDDKFHVQSFTINAGLEETFPWLHQLASCYEEYEVLQCVFQYRGHDIVGMQNTLDLQGQVIAATKYNVKSKSFTDRHEMQAYPHATSCSLNGTLQAGVEAAPGKIAAGDTHRYIRSGGLLVGEDTTDYDHARFELALNNTPTDLFNKEVGQLFCYYTVKLTKPRLHAGRGSAITSYRQFTSSTNTGYPFGQVGHGGTNQPIVASKNSLALVYTSALNNPKWEFPPHANGKFRCRFIVTGTNMEPANTDFGGTPVLAGEVTLGKSWPSTSGGTGENSIIQGAFGDSGSGFSVITMCDILVRPQVGATKNSISFTSTAFGAPSDTMSGSHVIIEEVNDYGEPINLPELVGLDDGLIKTVF